VNWIDIVERAEASGLHLAGFADQHHFLTGIISTWPDLVQARSLDSPRRVPEADVDGKARRALQTLLHPEMLGRSFQVLALGKEVDPPLATGAGVAAPIAGFTLARDPRLILGLRF
jgi:SAM-dependent MidA family methyltransferase